MRSLLAISKVVDAVNERIGWGVRWLILVAVLIGAGNAISRYALNISSNAWLEIQWYLFSAVFLLCAGYTFLRNEHIRIDVIQGNLSIRLQTWIDVFGIIVFLLPMAVMILWMSWPVFVNSYQQQEMSSNAGGLIRWPVKLLVPVGFALLVVQALSELVKRIAFLAGLTSSPTTLPPESVEEESETANESVTGSRS
jgi:TRAP-type mannitol/chloroaromatic compound transport system permease small subunit